MVHIPFISDYTGSATGCCGGPGRVSGVGFSAPRLEATLPSEGSHKTDPVKAIALDRDLWAQALISSLVLTCYKSAKSYKGRVRLAQHSIRGPGFRGFGVLICSITTSMQPLHHQRQTLNPKPKTIRIASNLMLLETAVVSNSCLDNHPTR